MIKNKRLRKFCYHYLFPHGGLLLVKLISRTYDIRLVDTHNEEQAMDEYGSIVYASWHQRFFPGITFFASRKPIAIMISQSRDGEMIARVVNILGWQAVRGSSTRGGRQALKQIRKLATRGYRIGHIVDGPQGPFGVVKPGLISIARFAGAPIVPTIVSAQRRWVFNSWDRFMIPKPFSKIVIRFGEPIVVPRNLDEESFEELRRHTQERIKELVVDTDNWWKDPDKMRHYFP